MDKLSLPALHAVNLRRGFTRELTEALAMLSHLERITGVASAASDSEPSAALSERSQASRS